MDRRDAATSRCVVWLASGGEAPAALLHALSRDGIANEIAVVADAPAVLRELIRGGVGRVVMHEPHPLSIVPELVDTVGGYFPGVTCFRFEPTLMRNGDPATALVPIQSRFGDEGNGYAAPVNGQHRDTQTIRPAQSSEVTPPSRAHEIDRDSNEGPLLSEEEVSMLLGPDDDGPGRDEDGA